MKLRLIEIGLDGSPARCPGEIPPAARDVIEGTVALYEDIGFHPPWVGYLADRDGEIVGCCAFKSLPQDGQVEIACESFDEHRGRGIASEMGRQLVEMARKAEPEIRIVAHTAASEDATIAILSKLGFQREAEVTLETEEEPTWRWSLEPEQSA